MTSDTAAPRLRRSRPLLVEIAWAAGAAVVSILAAALALGLDPGALARRWTAGGDDQILHYLLFTSATQTFPFATNEALGFPDGFNAFFSTQFDLASALTVSVLGIVIPNGIVLLNTFYLLTFGSVGAAAYPFFRVLGVRPWLSAGLAVVFALAPYHFLRVASGHAFLANYWTIPLLGILVLAAAGESTDPFRRWARSATSRRSLLLRRWAAPAVVALLIASGGGYYYVFAAIVVGGVWGIGAVSRLVRGGGLRSVLGGAAPVVALAVVIGAELLLLSLGYGERYAPYFEGRRIAESELYAGKFLPLLFPWAATGIPKLGTISVLYYAESGSSPMTEPPGLPLIASLALGVLLAALPVLALGGAGLRRSGVGRLLDDSRFRVLAAATLWTLAFYLLTGLGMAFAFLVGPTIRAWSRLSIVLCLLALGALALALERMRRRSLVVAASLLALVAVADQLLGVREDLPVGPVADDEVVQLVDSVDAALPDGCGVVQLPIKSFPDTGSIGGMRDYDEALPYLYTDDASLRWSYGSIEGTTGFDVWDGSASPASFAAAVRGSGACAVLVDTAAYPEDADAWKSLVGAVSPDLDPEVASSAGRWLLFEVPPRS
ncbi:hypothetical protein NB037_04965 [Rathayibacter sp. ZW T2_19]|uniref:Uncharacterized protein n=1 Tax=Rathayibacter rubneri TaxID=2950106 RepID=A0A9X2DVE0_9MICO|nr:hypothetical protein [Rathayibacter rubneri]MCM6761765.1 hypothetical protein [Rathayibacter rubneri]